MTEKPDSTIEAIKTVVYAVLLALMIRSVAFEPFNIPSGSMLPNLLVGDFVFVSKYTYGYSKFSFPFGIVHFQGRWWPGDAPSGPERGDVVVFKPPPRPYGDAFVKRVVGLPGDTLQVKEGLLYINGTPVKRKYLGTYQSAPGAKLQKKYMETLPNGVDHIILEISDDEDHDNTELFQIPDGHYFMMGDNRDNSSDSRVPNVVGYVPAANILGPARFFFFSVDEEFSFFKPWTWGHIRWNRLFKPVS